MFITVIGKRYLPSVRKRTGEKCTDSIVHFSYKDDSVEGLAVVSRWVGSFVCPPEQIIIGKQYEISESNGYINKFIGVTKEKGEELPW